MVMLVDRNDVQRMLREGAQLIDVLAPKEYEAEHLPGAVNIPLKTFGREVVRQLDLRRPVIVYCHDYQWDMSARAASRLEALEFQKIYRYQPGKADWFAAGLPREGKEAHTQRVADVAERDVPTCSINDSVAAVLERVRAAGGDACVAVDQSRVVLGLVLLESLEVSAPASVEEIMQSSPLTFRPNLEVGKLPEYVKTQRVGHALVTTSDGVLIGLLRFWRDELPIFGIRPELNLRSLHVAGRGESSRDHQEFAHAEAVEP